MRNLVIFYDRNKDILNIVNKYQENYQAEVYEIKTNNQVTWFDKFSSSYFGNMINVEKCNLNLNNYETIILVSPLWFNKLPSPIIRFLEPEVGKIKNIIYVLYNYNKGDYPKEFDKIDKVVNLRRNNSYFVSLDRKDIHVRVYQ